MQHPVATKRSSFLGPYECMGRYLKVQEDRSPVWGPSQAAIDLPPQPNFAPFDTPVWKSRVQGRLNLALSRGLRFGNRWAALG